MTLWSTEYSQFVDVKTKSVKRLAMYPRPITPSGRTDIQIQNCQDSHFLNHQACPSQMCLNDYGMTALVHNQ